MKKPKPTKAQHEEVHVPDRHFHHEEPEAELNNDDPGSDENMSSRADESLSLGRKIQDDDE